ncbi:hypothetical protein [Mycobacterium sp.]|uniref:hypothetical protein n=1 Tax=Mycobacterium sp. TaxID=1785 RepID=UPI0025CCF51A|nr:hypothetical protein [Mycobacterium sp.]MBW0012121.1 hypothetical protein [Mycobacterium sp.]
MDAAEVDDAVDDDGGFDELDDGEEVVLELQAVRAVSAAANATPAPKTRHLIIVCLRSVTLFLRHYCALGNT